MIYTITFNSSIDHMIWMEELQIGGLHRTVKETLTVGGKGLNVSRVLHELGIPTKVFGFVGGFTGYEVRERLQAIGISEELIDVSDGITRINVKIFDKNGIETEINGQGPLIGSKDMQALWDQLKSLTVEDWVVLSGSIPACIPNREHLYEEIGKELSGRGIPFVVDAEGEFMLNALQYRPFLVKPNLNELEQISQNRLDNKDDILMAAKKLQSLGARNVLVSLGQEGAILLSSTGDILQMGAAVGKTISTIGAGDSMVGGFIGGFLTYPWSASLKDGKEFYHMEKIPLKQYQSALRWGIACGSACAFSESLPSKAKIYEVLEAMDRVE